MNLTHPYRRTGTFVAVLAALALLATMLPPLEGQAADHLDYPGLTSPAGNPQADINDWYTFTGESPDSTVIPMTFVPAATGDASFGSDILYEIKIDQDGDAVEDLSYEFTFSEVRDSDAQFMVIQRAEGDAALNGVADGALIGYGQVGKGELTLNNGGTAWAGLRSDPFFFDLLGGLGTIAAADGSEPGDRTLNDGDENDFFLPLDVVGIVLEVPDTDFGLAEGTFNEAIFGAGTVGIWVTTVGPDGNQLDRSGRPGITTVFHHDTFKGEGADKVAFNQGEPADDAQWTDLFVEVFQTLSAGDTEGAYTQCQAETLASVFLPDILPWNKAGTLPAPVVGRALADDVIDTSLRVLTGGDPLNLFGSDGILGELCTDERDADGAINTDSIPPHEDYLAEFPYLGEPHAAVTVPDLGASTNFMAGLRGENEVPPVDTVASGLSAMRSDGSSLHHINILHRLEAAMAGHIHVGDPGENGPVVTFLYGPQDPPEDIHGIASQGSVEGGDLVAGTYEDLIDILRGGFAYVNFHTMDHPGGEIRGQVAPLDVIADRFIDDDDSVHEQNIDIIAAAQVTFGCNPPDNTEYCPDDDITRGQMAAFVARAYNLPDGPDAFTDDEDSIFETDINAIAAAGVTHGCNPPDNDEFCPEDNMTRGEMAAFLNRALGLPDGPDAFTDDENSIFEADINAIAAAGITLGCNPPANDNYCPENNVSREQMASFLARLFIWGA